MTGFENYYGSGEPYAKSLNNNDFENDNATSNAEAEEETILEETQFVQDVQLAPQSPIYSKMLGKANIVVAGIGGGGNNAVNNMINAGIKSANFIVMNTDMQALNESCVAPQCKIQLGKVKTGGLGAGSDPEIGRLSAEESREDIKKALEGIDLLFITAGMGGGTGTGAAPVVAEIAKGMGILTVAVVTKPFKFEGNTRMKNAEEGIKNLKNFVDTLLVIPNQKLIEVLDKNITFKKAFEVADDVLRQGVQGVSDLIVQPALINLDFADVRTTLSNKGLAHMGIGYGKGDKRILDAVRGAVYSPLLETDISGATAIIINVSGNDKLLLSEVDEACEIVRQVVAPNANIIFGAGIYADKTDVAITVIATGFVNKETRPVQAIGTSSADGYKPVMKALADVACDNEVKQNEPAKVERDVYNADIFAERPKFDIKSRQSADQAKFEPSTYQQSEQPFNQQKQPSYQQPQVERPADAERYDAPKTIEVKPSIIDVKDKQVPAFLRRLKKTDRE